MDEVERTLREHFGADERRIAHALKVTAFAERIYAVREGPRPGLVRAAALLHDAGIPAAERKHGSAAGPLQEAEGPPVAREILGRLGAPPELIEEVCRIIAHHHNGRIASPEFDAVWDADWLVNFPGEFGALPPAERERRLGRIFRTGEGRRLAREMFLGGRA